MIDQRVLALEKKVKEKQGEIAFVLREFSVSDKSNSGCFNFSAPTHSSKYEAGIINGNLRETFKDKFMGFKIPTANFSSDEKTYPIIGNFFVPVNLYLGGSLDNPFCTEFDIIPLELRTLEDLKSGKILFGAPELNPQSFYFKEGSPYKKFSLLIGDSEVRGFLEEKKVKDIDNFFEVFYQPQEIEKKIAILKYKDRESFCDKFVLHSSNLAEDFRKIKTLESSLLEARYIIEAEQDGIVRYWEPGQEVFAYSNLRNNISDKISLVSKQLELGKKLYAGTDFPLVSGDNIGFHGSITFLGQSDWLENEFIPEIQNTLSKIDNYLSNEKKKSG